MLRDQPKLGGSLQAALENVDFARWDDLPEATLPWETVSELASAQGIGEADVVWDMAAGLRPQPHSGGAQAGRWPAEHRPLGT